MKISDPVPPTMPSLEKSSTVDTPEDKSVEAADPEPELPPQPIKSCTMYKMGTPHFPIPDWTITLSRSKFPWKKIHFGPFDSNDCYEKFKEMVPDEFTFIRLIHGES